MAPTDLIDFLQTELAMATGRSLTIAPGEIAMTSGRSLTIAQRKAAQLAGPLHMVLWQLGLISLSQLDQVLQWMECHS